MREQAMVTMTYVESWHHWALGANDRNESNDIGARTKVTAQQGSGSSLTRWREARDQSGNTTSWRARAGGWSGGGRVLSHCRISNGQGGGDKGRGNGKHVWNEEEYIEKWEIIEDEAVKRLLGDWDCESNDFERCWDQMTKVEWRYGGERGEAVRQ